MRVQLSAMAMVLGPVLVLGACSATTNNVAIKDLEKLRAAQTTCLATNARQLDDRTSDPERIARLAATACNDATERLVAHALAHPQPRERQAFEEDAQRRAAGFVKLARGEAI